MAAQADAQPKSTTPGRLNPTSVKVIAAFVAGAVLGAASILKFVPSGGAGGGGLPGLGGLASEGGELLPGEPGAVEEFVVDEQGRIVRRSGGSSGGTSGGGTTGGSAGTAGRAGGRSGGGSTVGGGAGGGSGGTGGGSGSLACAAGRNGGATASGVSGTEIRIAAGVVTTGIGSGFLGEAELGIKAAIKPVNEGGLCGRRIALETLNTGWERTTGQRTIENWISSGRIFALVAQPDSEGLDAATQSGAIDRAGIPVVGTDGLLKSQYQNAWTWAVAASTVTNMHIIAQYAKSKLGATEASDFAIVFDTRYKFGPEGARALNNEVKRVLGTGDNIPGFRDPAAGCNQQYCGISADEAAGGYSSERATINNACEPCKIMVMLLEPLPMQTWMNQQGTYKGWYQNLFGGEPLFNDNLGNNCPGCGGMVVWTGYRPPLQPFDAEGPVASYCNAVHAQSRSADCHNPFTQGAFIGTKLFIEAVKRVCNAQSCSPLTRENLRNALNSGSYDFGLSQSLTFGSALPRVANRSMTAYLDNYSGSFNGWSYLGTGFLQDPSATQDLD